MIIEQSKKRQYWQKLLPLTQHLHDKCKSCLSAGNEAFAQGQYIVSHEHYANAFVKAENLFHETNHEDVDEFNNHTALFVVSGLNRAENWVRLHQPDQATITVRMILEILTLRFKELPLASPAKTLLSRHINKAMTELFHYSSYGGVNDSYTADLIEETHEITKQYFNHLEREAKYGTA